MQRTKLKGNAQRTPDPVPPDQDQRDRTEIRAHNFHPGLVRLGRREARFAARAGLGHAVVQERLQNPSIRIDARGAEGEFIAVPVTKYQGCEVGGREVPGEVRGEGREEVLLEIRCGSRG
jgi:hypothetical protein